MPNLVEEHSFDCPYCASPNVVQVELSGSGLGSGLQEFVVDCEVCCRPISIKAQFDGSDLTDFWVEQENG